MRTIVRYAIRAAVIVLLTGIWFLLDTRAVHACSCLAPPPPAEALAKSMGVFAGEVVSRRLLYDANAPLWKLRDDPSRFAIEYEFKVSAVWKGPSHETPFIVGGGGPCKSVFAEGERYLVYSRDGESSYFCSRTTHFSRAQEDFDVLGQGRVPVLGTRGHRPHIPWFYGHEAKRSFKCRGGSAGS